MTKDEPPARAGLRWRLDHARVAAPRWPWVALAAVLVGCGASQRPMRRAAPAVLEDPSRVRDWDALVRPDALYMLAAFVAASGDPSGERCPSVVRTGNEARIHGGCTDAAGDAWSGRARWVRNDDGAVDMQLRQLGTAKSMVDGRLHVDDEPMRAALDVYVVLDEPHGGPDGPTWLAIDYRGHRDPDGRWHGEGDIAAEQRGRVHARTSGLLVDRDQCPHEPLAGWTELEAGGHRVRVSYDGASDCDPTGTAHWTLDGVAQGELEDIDAGVGCRFDPNAAPGGVLGLLVLLGSWVRRRSAARLGPAPVPVP